MLYIHFGSNKQRLYTQSVNISNLADILFWRASSSRWLLLDLPRMHPLGSCTYQGLDCSSPALCIELYGAVGMAGGTQHGGRGEHSG